jgi:hypothetical protein
MHPNNLSHPALALYSLPGSKSLKQECGDSLSGDRNQLGVGTISDRCPKKKRRSHATNPHGEAAPGCEFREGREVRLSCWGPMGIQGGRTANLVAIDAAVVIRWDDALGAAEWWGRPAARL